MKARILTAHGYLSFQPPDSTGTSVIQYRPTAGAWEEFEVEAWDIQYVPPAPPETGGGGVPPPSGDLPGGIPPSESAEYVAAIQNWLLSQRVNLSGPCGAFEIVKNVAWGLQTLNTGAGLLSKPDGNNCQGYSVDIIAYKDYAHGGTRIVDILSDAGGQNSPLWLEKGPEENVAMDRWRPPINPAPAGTTSAQKSPRKK